MAYMGDVCVVTGTYQDQQGQEKARFAKIGSWFENEQGQLSVKLEALPLPDPKGEVWLKLFAKKDDQQQAPAQQQQQQRPQRQAPAQQGNQRRGRY